MTLFFGCGGYWEPVSTIAAEVAETFEGYVGTPQEREYYVR
jgi:hypothetical protein